MRRILPSTRAGMFLATVGCMLYGFAGMFRRAAFYFNDPKEDMSFAWLVAPFALYALWSERDALKRAAGAPSWVGLLACLPCLAVAAVGVRGTQFRLEVVSFVGLCLAVPWAFWGRRVAKLCLFPALYLLFTVPLASYLDVVTIHLRLFASGTAVAVMKGLGVDVVQRGTAVVAEGAHGFAIDVAEPCSGLRSLFALMALTAAYAWYTQPTWLRRGALFACSIPLAVLGNVVRILSICLVAAWTDQAFALGFYHDYSGYVVFIVAISCMVACGEGIDAFMARRGARRKSGTAGANEGRTELRPSREGRNSLRPRTIPAVVAAAVLCAAFVFLSFSPTVTLAEAPVFTLPETVAGCRGEEMRFCLNETCMRSWPVSHLEAGAEVCPACGGALGDMTLGEKTILPADTQIRKRVYQTSDGWRFLVSAVVGGSSKASIHRPELCLPAQGLQMRAPRSFTVDGRPYRVVTVTRPYAPPTALAYTFFNQEHLRTASHLRRIFMDTWDRSVHNRIDRWVMITVNASAPEASDGFDADDAGARRALEAFLSVLGKGLP